MRAALTQESPASNFARKSGVLHQKVGFLHQKWGFKVYNTPPKVDKPLLLLSYDPSPASTEKNRFLTR